MVSIQSEFMIGEEVKYRTGSTATLMITGIYYRGKGQGLLYRISCANVSDDHRGYELVRHGRKPHYKHLVVLLDNEFEPGDIVYDRSETDPQPHVVLAVLYKGEGQGLLYEISGPTRDYAVLPFQISHEKYHSFTN